MAKVNTNLHSAKKEKNDEFYTTRTDVENELKYYKNHFAGKTILCNCNDALHTSFAEYFSLRFETLGLKELICTSFNPDGQGEVYRYHGDTNSNGIPDMEEWEHYPMDGNGGFNTPEGIALLDECDIVVTNPPFSLFREFIALLMEHDKKFIIIGNMNAVTYKEVFPLIKENKMWLGQNVKAGTRKGNSLSFSVDGDELKQVSAWWYTNLDCPRHNEFIDLYKKYNPEEYPKYDNYDAIEVSKSCDIPEDYKGIMGVPISFLMFHCPEQFEIVDARDYALKEELKHKATYLVKDADGSINGKAKYARILIKSK